jgi:cytoskeletal protein CcmA (bactofilin family)
MSEYSENFNGSRNLDTAYIPKGTVINGDIQISGRLNMFGEVNGNITSDDHVNIVGDVTGNIKADNVDTRDSYIVGNIDCIEGTTVHENTVIFGNLNANNLVIDGAIQGKIDVKGDIVVGEKAIVDSDIKAKTINVSNGAAINGYCSLCYADVNVKDFFPEDVKQESKEAVDKPQEEENHEYRQHDGRHQGNKKKSR